MLLDLFMSKTFWSKTIKNNLLTINIFVGTNIVKYYSNMPPAGNRV